MTSKSCQRIQISDPDCGAIAVTVHSIFTLRTVTPAKAGVPLSLGIARVIEAGFPPARV